LAPAMNSTPSRPKASGPSNAIYRDGAEEAGYNPAGYLVLRTLMSASRAPAAA
jgi:hypothetical protein